MILIDNKSIGFIHPTNKAKSIDDELTAFVKSLKLRENLDFTKGLHTCTAKGCKQIRSTSNTFTVTLNGKSYKTNSLLSHYVEFHRDEMPIAQLNILITAMNCK